MAWMAGGGRMVPVPRRAAAGDVVGDSVPRRAAAGDVVGDTSAVQEKAASTASRAGGSPAQEPASTEAGVEHRLHYVRDVTLHEDHSRVRSGATPHALVAYRNLALTLLRRAGHANIAATCAPMPAARPTPSASSSPPLLHDA